MSRSYKRNTTNFEKDPAFYWTITEQKTEHRKMKSYGKGKKYHKSKDLDKLEADNANRAAKKAERQKARRLIESELNEMNDGRDDIECTN